MRPSHIRVFDGLRVTTEHMNHLQGSFQSALQEIRQVLGVERVHYGFDVVNDGKGSLTVHPGVAFDRNQNRVVLDEPKTIVVTFIEGQTSQYVCARYVQSEDGNVEGHPTMIWDDCEIAILTDRPDEAEGMICLAKIEKGTDVNAPFVIHDLRFGKEHHHDRHADTAKGDMKSSREETVGDKEVRTSAEAKGTGPRISWNQGVAKCRPKNEGIADLQSLILEPLRARTQGGNPQSLENILVELGSFDVPSLSESDSVQCESLLSIEIHFTTTNGTEPSPNRNGAESTHRDWRAQSNARGEITQSDGRLLQYGLSQMQCSASGNGVAIPWPPAKLDDGAICVLPFSVFDRTGLSEEQRPFLNLFRYLDMRVFALMGVEGGLKIVCHLNWQGGVTGEHLLLLEKASIGFKWEAMLGWKTTVLKGG